MAVENSTATASRRWRRRCRPTAARPSPAGRRHRRRRRRGDSGRRRRRLGRPRLRQQRRRRRGSPRPADPARASSGSDHRRQPDVGPPLPQAELRHMVAHRGAVPSSNTSSGAGVVAFPPCPLRGGPRPASSVRRCPRPWSRPPGIRVNAVCPGAHQTGMLAESMASPSSAEALRTSAPRTLGQPRRSPRPPCRCARRSSFVWGSPCSSTARRSAADPAAPAPGKQSRLTAVW